MISIVIPVHNEEGNISSLCDEIMAIPSHIPIKEIIFVDDGSTDTTLQTLRTEKQKYPDIQIIHQSPCAGQSTAFWNGVHAATQPIIVTMDGDGQNNPVDIAAMLQIYQNAQKPLMIAGQRTKRHDSILRKISSRTANFIRSAILNDGVHDTGCSLKMFARDDYLRLPYFNHMHRFLPALMQRDGINIVLCDVSHRPRMHGISKYGVMNRLWIGIVDLFGVLWLKHRAYPKNIRITKE